MIVAFPEPCTPKEKSHPVFICPLGLLDTVYTVVISKNKFAFGSEFGLSKIMQKFCDCLLTTKQIIL